MAHLSAPPSGLWQLLYSLWCSRRSWRVLKAPALTARVMVSAAACAFPIMSFRACVCVRHLCSPRTWASGASRLYTRMSRDPQLALGRWWDWADPHVPGGVWPLSGATSGGRPGVGRRNIRARTEQCGRMLSTTHQRRPGCTPRSSLGWAGELACVND